MADRRNPLGQPEEENTALESTQSASGLTGGTPTPGRPAQQQEGAGRHDDKEHSPDDRAGRER